MQTFGLPKYLMQVKRAHFSLQLTEVDNAESFQKVDDIVFW
jgi:hypothetical protein